MRLPVAAGPAEAGWSGRHADLGAGLELDRMASVLQVLDRESHELVVGSRHRAALAVRQNHGGAMPDANDALDRPAVHIAMEMRASGIRQVADLGLDLLAIAVDIDMDDGSEGGRFGETALVLLGLHWYFSCLILIWADARGTTQPIPLGRGEIVAYLQILSIVLSIHSKNRPSGRFLLCLPLPSLYKVYIPKNEKNPLKKSRMSLVTR